MTTHDSIAIYGAGGFAREVAWLLEHLIPPTAFHVLGYIDDHVGADSLLGGLPVRTFEAHIDSYGPTPIALAIGKPRTRRALAERVLEAGCTTPSLVHESVMTGPRVEYNDGVMLCAGTILTVDITLEHHILINLDCTIGHDVRIGAFTTLSPGVHVSGNVHIGSDVFIGTGVNIINGLPEKPLVIGDGAVIAAGACVTSDVPAQTLVAGVPAKVKRTFDVNS